MTIVYNLTIEEGINGSALLPNGSSNGNVINDLEVNDIILGTQLQPNGTQQNGFGVSNTLVDEGINQSNIDLVLIGPQQLGYTILADGNPSFDNGNYFIFSSSESSPTEYVILKPDISGGNFTTYKNQMMNLINGNTITSITLENLIPILPKDNALIQLIRAQINNIGEIQTYSVIGNTTLLLTNNPVNFTGLEQLVPSNDYYLCIIFKSIFGAPKYDIPVQIKATVQYS